MYECCSLKRFLRLLLLDAIIFGLCLLFFFIGRIIVFSFFPELSDNEKSTQPPSSAVDELSDYDCEGKYTVKNVS